MCCGGHGFLKSAGLSYLLELQSPYVTLEGENAVMAQQTARDLMKNYRFALVQEYRNPISGYLWDY